MDLSVPADSPSLYDLYEAAKYTEGRFVDTPSGERVTRLYVRRGRLMVETASRIYYYRSGRNRLRMWRRK